MRSVQKLYVWALGKRVEMEIFDTFNDEVLDTRFVGVLEVDGVKYEVAGPYSTSCQVKASRLVAEEVSPEYPMRRFIPRALPPYRAPAVEEEEEASVA